VITAHQVGCGPETGFEEMISRAKSSTTSGWDTRSWGARPRRCR